ncbi:Reverse transcriptase zinc-binding domain [Thalictrum thalictroides]|uniref:Reverse transcriptase zinc-binding domain n=1 Tax=Thalictrum thalictroides TaxID=46969 RepID=A0A7J6VTD2_THATH|nr:Reverse transcriptase zinc-binding domain [Thalictrum thalictroides]
MLKQCKTISESVDYHRSPQRTGIWIPPREKFLKLNVDIKFTGADQRIGIGYILRTADGIFAGAGCCSNSAGSAEESESRGVLEALHWAHGKHVTHLELETDNKGVADYLIGAEGNLSWRTTILDNVLMLFNSFVIIKVPTFFYLETATG